MLKRVTRMLVAFIVSLGLAMPIGVHAMPMPGATIGMASAVDQPCQHCPQPHETDKMPACQGLACIGATAVLPSPVLVPARVYLRTDYVSPVIARLAGAEPAPDPFPPRPVVLL